MDFLDFPLLQVLRKHLETSLQDEQLLESAVGSRLALLRVAMFTSEELSGALAIPLQLGLAFCDPALLPAGRVAIASVESERWPEMLRYLGEEDFEDLGDGQVARREPFGRFQLSIRASDWPPVRWWRCFRATPLALHDHEMGPNGCDIYTDTYYIALYTYIYIGYIHVYYK